jgi:hypothetical protein
VDDYHRILVGGANFVPMAVWVTFSPARPDFTLLEVVGDG